VSDVIHDDVLLGRKEGETKVVNVRGKGAQVFQWSEEAREWKYVNLHTYIPISSQGR
jgi:hypothetical protein